MQPNIHTLVKLTKRYKIYSILSDGHHWDWHMPYLLIVLMYTFIFTYGYNISSNISALLILYKVVTLDTGKYFLDQV